jgi:hypothetical protein
MEVCYTARNRSNPKWPRCYGRGLVQTVRAHFAMWMLGIAGGAIVVALAVWKAMRRGSSRGIDVGPVSDAWLAEQRARGRESQY